MSIMARNLEASRRWPIVYLHGSIDEADVWYAIDFDRLLSGTGKRDVDEADPPAFVFDDEIRASCVIIDEYIYLAGIHVNAFLAPSFGSHLHRRCITGTRNYNWEKVCSAPNYFRARPLMFTVDNNDIYIVGIKYLYFESSHHDEFFPKIGLRYNLDSKTFTDLKWDVQKNGEWRTTYPVAVVEKEGEPTRFGFCNLDTGGISFYDGFTWVHEDHPNLAIRKSRLLQFNPQGLDPSDNLYILDDVASSRQPLVYKATLYWLAYDLHLYGYDLDQKRWFVSKSLEGDLPELAFMITDEFPLAPFLVHLCENTFLFLCFDKYAKLAMVSLQVDKEKDSLSVSVEILPSFIVDPDFLPISAHAMLCKMHG